MAGFDRDYYERRLSEEAERALHADTDVGRIAHQRLAELYRALLSTPVDPSYRRNRAHIPPLDRP